MRFQLILACALRDVPKAQQPGSIPKVVTTWAILPLAKWGIKLDIPADMLVVGDRLLDPECDGSPTALCRKLSRGEAMPRIAKGATIADRTANPKAIALVLGDL